MNPEPESRCHYSCSHNSIRISHNRLYISGYRFHDFSFDVPTPFILGKRSSVVRGYEALAKQCQLAALKAPERVTSTNLRKYMATLTQVRTSFSLHAKGNDRN